MEKEIVKMLIEEIKAERELRKKLLRRLESLDSYGPYSCVSIPRSIREEHRIVTVTEKPNSYVFGKACNRFKIYFEKQEDAEKAVDACKNIEEYKNKKFGGSKGH